MKYIIKKSILAVSLLVGITSSLSADVSVPNVFSSGDPAKASEVNENFSTLLNYSKSHAIGMKYANGGNIPNATLNSWGIRDVNPNTIIRQVNITSPIDGYAVISVAGKTCIHTENEYLEIMLSKNGTNYIDGVNIASFSGADTHQPCGVGQSKTFAFRHVEAVTKGSSYNFYLLGHKGSSNTISANVYIGDMTVIVYPSL